MVEKNDEIINDSPDENETHCRRRQQRKSWTTEELPTKSEDRQWKYGSSVQVLLYPFCDDASHFSSAFTLKYLVGKYKFRCFFNKNFISFSFILKINWVQILECILFSSIDYFIQEKQKDLKKQQLW